MASPYGLASVDSTHSSAVFKGLIIHWEPRATEELPLNLTNPV